MTLLVQISNKVRMQQQADIVDEVALSCRRTYKSISTDTKEGKHYTFKGRVGKARGVC